MILFWFVLFYSKLDTQFPSIVKLGVQELLSLHMSSVKVN